MSYIDNNKAAWEEAFEHRQENWGDENYRLLKKEELPFFDSNMKQELKALDLKDKSVAQFCCNNGRELLSLMQLGVTKGVGFDIAENILEQARNTADKAGIKNCEFVAGSILDIPKEYENQFDFIYFTIGAIVWFEDLELLFQKAADCLKPGGRLLIHECHPLMNMLPFPGDKEYNEKELNRLVFSYFRKEPWIETNGMGYISGDYESKPFTSFTHTLSSIINSLSVNGIRVMKLNEYDYDIGVIDVYDNKGFPLSMLLIAEKN